MSLTPDERRKAKAAMEAGRISQQEYRHLTRRTIDLSTILVVIMVALAAGVVMFSGGGITGFVTAEWNATTYTNSTTIDLGVSEITGVKVSGELVAGSVTINAVVGNATYLVYAESLPERRIWTNKTSYGVNETVDLFVDMENYTLWLDDGNKTPVTEPLMINETGNYTIETLGNEKLSIDIQVIENASGNVRLDTVTFSNVCATSCVMTPSNESVRLEILTDGVVRISDVVVIGQNTAPELIQEIPNAVLDDIVMINLSRYFVDAEADEITYEMNNILGVIENIDGDIVTLEGTAPGTYLGTIYAGDGQAITTAEFTIVVPGGEAVTNNTTANTTKVPPGHNQVFGCDHPNISKRPPECFGNEFDAAFQEVTAPLKDKQLNKVGRFTRYGNLVIRGSVIEESGGSPGPNAFTIGTVLPGLSQEYVPTAWIDSASGDLHLRGSLYEETANLNAPTFDSYVVTNSNGIVLGYFDETTGDLYLRGNIVQLGKP